MCYLAAIILIHLSRPEQCFIAFSNLILKYDILRDFYDMDSESMLAAYRVYWKLIMENCPTLYLNMV